MSASCMQLYPVGPRHCVCTAHEKRRVLGGLRFAKFVITSKFRDLIPETVSLAFTATRELNRATVAFVNPATPPSKQKKTVLRGAALGCTAKREEKNAYATKAPLLCAMTVTRLVSFPAKRNTSSARPVVSISLPRYIASVGPATTNTVRTLRALVTTLPAHTSLSEENREENALPSRATTALTLQQHGVACEEHSDVVVGRLDVVERADMKGDVGKDARHRCSPPRGRRGQQHSQEHTLQPDWHCLRFRSDKESGRVA